MRIRVPIAKVYKTLNGTTILRLIMLKQRDAPTAQLSADIEYFFIKMRRRGLRRKTSLYRTMKTHHDC